MILQLRMTRLAPEVRRGILEKTYSREEVLEIYAYYLEKKKNIGIGMKRAGITLLVVALVMPILSLLAALRNQQSVEDLMLPLMMLLLIYALVYYLLFGHFERQLLSALGTSYPEILEKKTLSQLRKGLLLLC